MLGMVLMSGGARGAYQAGVLRALGDILGEGPTPFPVLTGLSAGAINASYMAIHADRFGEAARNLCDIWSTLHFRDVFDTRTLGVTLRGLRWLADLSLGGLGGTGRGRSLLNPTPLRERLAGLLPLEKVKQHIHAGLLHALAVTATHYPSGLSVTFFEGAPALSPWERSTRIGLRTALQLDHVLASGAIPVFFPAVRLNDGYFGDGAVRMTTPLSPALHLGADRVLAVAIHHQDATFVPEVLTSAAGYPSLAEMGGVLLNAIFLRTLDADVERLRRINQTLALMTEEQRKSHPQKLRTVPILVLRPSQRLSPLVRDVIGGFPYPVRHLLKGLGAEEDTGFELLSYLAFEPSYTERLMELGYRDTLSRRQEIEAFVLGDREQEPLSGDSPQAIRPSLLVRAETPWFS